MGTVTVTWAAECGMAARLTKVPTLAIVAPTVRVGDALSTTVRSVRNPQLEGLRGHLAAGRVKITRA